MIQHLVMRKTKPALPWHWMYWNQSFWPSFLSPTRGRSTHPVLCPLPPAQTCMCCRRGWHHPPGWGSAARLPSPSSNYTTQHCIGSHCILCFFGGKAVRRGDGDGGCPGKDVKCVRPAANPPAVLNRASQGSASPALPLLSGCIWCGNNFPGSKAICSRQWSTWWLADEGRQCCTHLAFQQAPTAQPGRLSHLTISQWVHFK